MNFCGKSAGLNYSASHDSRYISNIDYFTSTYTRTIGVTGTLGNVVERSLYKQELSVDTAEVPRFQKSLFELREPSLIKDRETWFARLKAVIRREAARENVFDSMTPDEEEAHTREFGGGASFDACASPSEAVLNRLLITDPGWWQRRAQRCSAEVDRHVQERAHFDQEERGLKTRTKEVDIVFDGALSLASGVEKLFRKAHRLFSEVDAEFPGDDIR